MEQKKRIHPERKEVPAPNNTPFTCVTKGAWGCWWKGGWIGDDRQWLVTAPVGGADSPPAASEDGGDENALRELA